MKLFSYIISSLLFLILGCLPLSAHLLNMTEVTAALDESSVVEISLRIDLSRELGTNAAYYAFSQKPDAQLLAEHAGLFKKLTDAVEMKVDGERVPLVFVSVEPPREATLKDFESPFEWPRTRVQLSAPIDPAATTLQITFLKEMAFEEPIALFMRSEVSGLSKSRWLVAGQSSPVFVYVDPAVLPEGVEIAELPKAHNRFADLPSYLVLGFEHILPMGVDHLVFVLGIFLAARTMRSLIGQISVFTLAHTLTLGLASYKIIEPPIQLVEILIAVSILWIGVENIWIRKQGKGRYFVIAGFGLLHGMGFASALSGLDLPRDNFIVALLGFNVGVELGQLTFIAILFALLGWFRGKDWYGKFVMIPLSLVISGVAIYWVVERI